MVRTRGAFVSRSENSSQADASKQEPRRRPTMPSYRRCKDCLGEPGPLGTDGEAGSSLATLVDIHDE